MLLKKINITGLNKVHLKCDCIDGSIVNGTREPILYSSALDQPPGHKIYKEPRINFFRKINKRVLSRLTFYPEDDDYRPVDFKNETVSFTCQLKKYNKTWIYTIIFVLILGYSYTYMSIFTFIRHGYIQLYDYLYFGILTIIRVVIQS